jgi:hypothetical protein
VADLKRENSPQDESAVADQRRKWPSTISKSLRFALKILTPARAVHLRARRCSGAQAPTSDHFQTAGQSLKRRESKKVCHFRKLGFAVSVEESMKGRVFFRTVLEA